jgi:hypothetical protein
VKTPFVVRWRSCRLAEPHRFQVLANFASVWDVLTPENRGRLLRAVVQRVEVDEPANRVRMFMADLEAGLPGALASRETEQEATA